MATTPKIQNVRHPYYTASLRNWLKWRLTYESTDRFIQTYLKRMSKREDDTEFSERKALTYNPAFAKLAVNEVRNSIYKQMSEVIRVGGDETYQDAIEGLGAGVDKEGSTMNAFIGRRILPELLPMSRVGVYVDMPPLPYAPTKLDVKGKSPYLCWYATEDICSWTKNDNHEYTEVLLQDSVTQSQGDDFYLPYAVDRVFRHVWINDDGYVSIKTYTDGGSSDDDYSETITLGIRTIPFHVFELPESLLADVANYQIALMNLDSSDMAYLMRANFPFYVEQFDPKTQSPYIKTATPNRQPIQSTQYNPQTMIYQATADKTDEVRVGVATGRRYPVGAERPAFISPSTDPVHASMAKQDQMKREIRDLVLGTVSQLATNIDASAMPGNQSSLESGLAHIGLELQHGERKIAKFWAMYVGGTPATISYPENYDLKTDEDRRKEAADLEALMAKLPSKTYQREIAKRMAKILLGPKVSIETLEEIYKEIDDAVIVTTDPEIVQSDFEAGFVGLDTASKIRGYPAGEVEKAKVDHADRIARIAIAQSEGAGAPAKAGGLDNPSARGVKDMAGNMQGGKQERTTATDTTTKGTTKDLSRGEGK